MSEFIIVSNDLAPSVIEVSSSGPQGSSGTVSVGTVTTGASGSAAAVTNSGTPSAAVLNFTIPKGDIGDVTPAATAAKNAAEAAATAAAASELAAETAEQSAGTFASNASSSATAASASAATANTKAQEASTSASNAAASAQSVLTAANTATIKAQEADASAYAASLSANTATTKAQEASTSATTADTKAQEAVVSANVATNKAQEASASAVTALSAQQISTENATVAIAQGNLATTKAAEADASANDALVQASIATAQAQEATAQVDLATAQAVISTTQAGISTAQATISTTQADIATTQANTSTAQATIATTKASEASTSALDSQASATAAATAQTSASASASTATAEATLATTARTAAETARDAAIVAQNNAVAVVTGGTATLTPSAGKIPLSDAQGKIAKGWLTNTELVEQTDIGTAPNEIPLNQFLGEMAYYDAQNIPAIGVARADIAVANAATANVTNLLQVTDISNVVPSLNLDFAKVKQLDPRITFARASTATYYDGKTLAKAEENLLINSVFAGAVAGTPGVTPVGWTRPAVATINSVLLGFDGVSNIISVSATASRDIFQQTISVAANSTIQAQIFLVSNADGLPIREILNWVLPPSGSVVSWTINGVSSIDTAVPSENSLLTARLVVSSVSGTALWRCGVGVISNQTGTISFTRPQCEQRSSVTAYTPTTTQTITNYIPALQTAPADVPRFDHNPVTGESLGLEIEEQRTNLVVRSEEFDNSAWSKNGATVSANSVVAPNGSITADKLVTTTTAGAHGVASTLTITQAAVYTSSCFAKQGEYRYAALTVSTSGYAIAYFDLETGVVTSVSGSTNPTANIVAVGNGWYRISITAAAGTAGVGGIFAISTPNTLLFTGDGTSGIYIWGAQLELGVFPTSYIPTVDSQVTRAADTAVMTGANFSSWYRPDEGTLFAEAFTSSRTRAIPNAEHILTTTSQFTLLRGASSVSLGWFLGSGTFKSFNYTDASILFKSAGAYKMGDNAAVLNGGSLVTETVANLGSVTALYIGSNVTGNLQLNGTIKKISYYPQRLSNAELFEMTA